MENKTPDTIDYFTHEGMMARMERIIRRLWILCIIIFLALVGTNAYWIWYESQFEDQVITQELTQDSGEGGTNTYTGNIVGGDMNGEAGNKDNGETESS